MFCPRCSKGHNIHEHQGNHCQSAISPLDIDIPDDPVVQMPCSSGVVCRATAWLHQDTDAPAVPPVLPSGMMYGSLVECNAAGWWCCSKPSVAPSPKDLAFIDVND